MCDGRCLGEDFQIETDDVISVGISVIGAVRGRVSLE